MQLDFILWSKRGGPGTTPRDHTHDREARNFYNSFTLTHPSHKADDDAWGDDAGEDHIAKGIGEGNTSSRHVGGHLEQQGSLASLMIFRDLGASCLHLHFRLRAVCARSGRRIRLQKIQISAFIIYYDGAPSIASGLRC